MKTITNTATVNLDATETIGHFFNCYHLSEALHLCHQLTKLAVKSAWCPKRSAGYLLRFTKQLNGLCEAADQLNYSVPNTSVMLYGKDLVSSVHTLVQVALVNTKWEDLPRHLTAQEFIDPYIAIKRFSRKMKRFQMKEVLFDHLEFALGKATIDGCYTCDELRQFRARLMGLIEACYLIWLRKDQYNNAWN